MKSVRGPVKEPAGSSSVTCRTPSPAGCSEMTVVSPGPEMETVMPASRPLSEKRHRSAVLLPLAGRCSVTGLPSSVQELLAVENAPMAATFRSTSSATVETPAVVGSTTTMFCPLALGVAPVKAIVASDEFGAATTRLATLLLLPSGFCTCTVTVPAIDTSLAFTGTIHCVTELQCSVEREQRRWRQ